MDSTTSRMYSERFFPFLHSTIYSFSLLVVATVLFLGATKRLYRSLWLRRSVCRSVSLLAASSFERFRFLRATSRCYGFVSLPHNFTCFSYCLFRAKFEEKSYLYTTKGGSRRLEKSHKVWMMMMIAASLMWAGAAEMPEQSKMTFKNYQSILYVSSATRSSVCTPSAL